MLHYHITVHGLNFNPSKTIHVCTTFGKQTLTDDPQWFLRGCRLREDPSVTYLGTLLANDPQEHITERAQSARRAFYALQSSDVCPNGVSPQTLSHMFNVAIQPVLTYGCSALNISDKHMKYLEKAQCKLIKAALGLPTYCRNTPLLEALGIKRVADVIQFQQLSLLRNALRSTSRARTFYLFAANKFEKTTNHPCNLVSRYMSVCGSRRISPLRFIFDDKYPKICKRSLIAHG